MYIVIGLLIIAIGAFCQSSSYVPINKIKSWCWESYWLVQGIFAWLVFPLAGALLAVPQGESLLSIYASFPKESLLTILFGVLWGVGGLTFGLSMRYLGVALGQSIALGTCSGMGAILGPVLTGHAGDLTFAVIFGVVVMLAGIAVIGIAGGMKSAALPEAEKKEAVKDFNFKKGIAVALLAGLMSACFNIGLSFGAPLQWDGTDPLFASLPATLLVTFGGFLTNAVYCLWQNARHKTFADYRKGSVWGHNLIFCALAGLLWYSQFFGLSLGKGFLADSVTLITFSWCILMALNVTFSNLWGIILKEWKGVSRKTVIVLITGLVILVFSTFLPQLISSRSEDERSDLLCENLPSEYWESSCWISAQDAPVVTHAIKSGDRAADGASWFVIDKSNEKKVSGAKWMTTSLGIYEIYVNGTPVGIEFLKPGYTSFEKTRRSFTYDVTSLIDAAKGATNRFSAEITPGWWADGILTPAGHIGMNGRKPAFRAVLELTYTDGTRELVGTDTTSWKAGVAGPVTHAAIFDGEDYDARLLPGYAVAETLGTPELNSEFPGVILPDNGAEVYLRGDLELSPAEAYVYSGATGAVEGECFGKVDIARTYSPSSTIVLCEGETLVVDFGQNCAAVPLFEFKADEGTTLTCLPGELLNDGNGALSRGMDGPEGSVHRTNLRTFKTGMRIGYTFAGGGKWETYHPRFSFFGYRYVSITATGRVEIRKITSVPVSSITPELETGTLKTGSDLINKLISNTVWGQRSNYLSVPTDCPQRDERLGWMADTQVFCETGTFFANTDAFFHKWLQDVRDVQDEEGGYPGVAPLAQYGSRRPDMMRVGWADAGVIVPWTVWKQFADTSVIDESWTSMEKYLDHITATCYDHNAHKAENNNYQWADWLSYEPLESCSGKAWKDGKLLPEASSYWSYLSACYWIINAGMMRDMAAATGRDAEKYEAIRAKAIEYTKDKFLDENGLFKTAILNTMQTPALFALHCGLVGGGAKEDMLARLRQNFADHGQCLQTGFLGTSILMDVLTNNAMSDVAYDLLFQRKNPSWLYSVDNGATTIWERWDSYVKETGMGPKGMNSFNHYAYGCVCAWLWKTAAGIAADPACPGFKHIIMKPVPDQRLGSIDAEYKSAAGLIKSSWKYDDRKWTWNFTIPEGATATVCAPGDEPQEYTAGSYTIQK